MVLRVVDTKPQAIKTFETFYAREPAKEIEFSFGWPKRMQEIGVGGAEMYRSNKWQKSLSEHEDYKHVAEGSRTVYAEPGFLREWGSPSKKIEVVGPIVKFEEPMPKHFTQLGPLLGVQVRLYEESDNGDLIVRKGDEGLYEVSVARAWLGSARHPKTNEVFLFVYTPDGVHMILTGGSLTITKDGIAG
jgi:hypothetical protein